MDIGILLLISGCVAVGVVAAVLKTWMLHRRTYSLEDRMALLEGILQREVKTRAAQARWQKPDKDEALLAAMQAQPARPRNWWEVAVKQKVS